MLNNIIEWHIALNNKGADWLTLPFQNFFTFFFHLFAKYLFDDIHKLIMRAYNIISLQNAVLERNAIINSQDSRLRFNVEEGGLDRAVGPGPRDG
jgi:hypothetical protein